MKQAQMSRVTKNRLAQSLKKHMIKKPLDKITIKELTEDCNLNRQTFYYHFQDIYELTTWMFHQETLMILNQKQDAQNWQDSLHLILNYIDANKPFWKSALDNVGTIKLKEIFYENAAHMIHLIIMEHVGALEISEKYITFLSDFYIQAVLGEIINWINGNLNISKEELLHYLEVTIHGNVQSALERAGIMKL